MNHKLYKSSKAMTSCERNTKNLENTIASIKCLTFVDDPQLIVTNEVEAHLCTLIFECNTPSSGCVEVKHYSRLH